MPKYTVTVDFVVSAKNCADAEAKVAAKLKAAKLRGKAGADLYEARETQWLHSSSTDFPRDYKKGFKGDVHDYIEQGYKTAAATEEAPRVRVIEKMLAWCSMEQFQQSLTVEEKAAFAKIKREYETREE
jgi:hypothetical protein